MNKAMRSAAALLLVFLFLESSTIALAQSGPAGPVVIKNTSNAALTVSNLRYVGEDGDTRALTGEWTLKPGFYGRLLQGSANSPIIARKITYDLTTSEGKTVNWSCESTALDSDGDFSSLFTHDNLATHFRLLGQTPAEAFKPVAPAVIADPRSLPGYDDFAAIASEPLFDDATVDKALSAYTDSAIMSLKEYQRQKLEKLPRLESSLQSVREQAEAALWKCNFSYKAIRQLDSNTPDFEGMVKKAVDAAPGLMKDKANRTTDDSHAINMLAAKAIWEVGSTLANSYKLSEERSAYARHYNDSRSAMRKAMLAVAPQRYALVETRPDNSSVSIPYIKASLANTYVNDFIAVRNDSGKDLTGCTLLVAVEGIHAATGNPEGDYHFHYVTSWRAGESKYLWYPSRGASGMAANQSADVIQNVAISFYSDQLKTVATFDFSGRRYDEYVQGWADKHLPGSAFSGRWYTDRENLLDPSGFQVTYNGSLSSFTVERVTIEAIDGDRSVRIYNGDHGWKSGQKKWICHSKFNGIDPSVVKVVMSFPGSSYEHVINWKR